MAKKRHLYSIPLYLSWLSLSVNVRYSAFLHCHICMS